MRSLKSSLLAVGIAGFFGCAAVIGCSASGDSGVTDDSNGTNPDNGSASLPPPSSTGGDQPTDAGKDASKPKPKSDAGKDAGPPPPTPGTACTNLNDKKSKPCGKCGTAETVCLDDGSGKTGKWSDYGQCENEMGDCSPGGSQACGNCGTQTCTNYCVWGACTGEPANSCAPNAVDYTTAGCATAGTYRNRTCGAACTWGSYSAACTEPNNPNKLAIAGAVNGTASGTYALTASKVGKQPPTSTYYCAKGPVSATADYPYEIVELRNNTGKTATITVTSPQSAFRVTVAAYPTDLPPQSDADLIACTKADYNYSSYDAVFSGVSMPPNARYLLRITSYYPTTDVANTSTGNATVTVKTTALN